MKKKLLFITFLISIFVLNVNAKEVQVYFYAEGGKVASSDFKISGDYVVYKDDTDHATYKDTDTVKNINSIGGHTFNLKKDGYVLSQGREWYVQNAKTAKYVALGNNKTYKMSDIISSLDLTNDPYPVVSLHAYWTTDTTKKDDNTTTSTKKTKVKIIINTNGGNLILPHGNDITTIGGYIFYKNNKTVSTIPFGGQTSSAGLMNYNNGSFINIARSGYKVEKGAEWNTKSDGTGKTYSQSKVYKASDFCDAYRRDCGVTLYVNWKKEKLTKWGITQKEIDEIEKGSRQITYELFGATSSDKKNDFEAIWKAHQFANYELIEKGRNLTVYACNAKDCSNKQYYISEQKCPMSDYCDTDKDVPIYVGTNTDLRNANFILDDGAKGVDPTKDLFLISSRTKLYSTLNKKGSFIFLNNSAKESLSKNQQINPNTTNLKSIVNAVKEGKIVKTNNKDNKVSDNEKKILLDANKWGISVKNKKYSNIDDALKKHIYIRESASNSDYGVPKQDEIIIDSGSGNVLTPIDWTSTDIDEIVIYPIDNTKKIFKNGHFTTYTDNRVYETNSTKKNSSRHRGISVQYSGNVEIYNIKHDISEKEHPYKSNIQTNPNGNWYYGFIYLYHAGQVKLQTLQLVPHQYVQIYDYSNKKHKSGNDGTYDLIIDNSTNIVLNNVTHGCKSGDSECYGDRMLNEKRWGVIGMNSVKNIFFTNCRLNRIDAHRGVTNLYVENSSIGYNGFTLTGHKNFYAKNIKIDKAPRILRLRDDYGATWDGTMVFNGVQFVVKDNINEAIFVLAKNTQKHNFGYKSHFPNLYMNNITIDTKTKKAKASRISIMDLGDTDEINKKNENNLYYFDGIMSFTDIKFDNYKSQPAVYLFTNNFDKNKNNYLMSRYGGNNQVAIYKDSVIKNNSNYKPSSSTKFKNASTTGVNGRINEMETFFKNLRSSIGVD